MNRNFFTMQRQLLGLLCATMLALTGCMSGGAANTPEIPEKLTRNGDGVPVLKVYDVDSDSVDEMDVETYVMGVVAGEMRNTWPIEALKAHPFCALAGAAHPCASRAAGHSFLK